MMSLLSRLHLNWDGLMKYPLTALKGAIKRARPAAPLVRAYSSMIGRHRKPLPSDRFWEKRYREGDNSGPGSYGRLAEYKAEILNAFVSGHNVDSVIEFGCGDGNQLRLCSYPRYLGIDVSRTAVDRCIELFASDQAKRFCLLDDYDGERADLALSLDVIYHLIEDSVFEHYMRTLFAAAERYVVLYTSNFEHDPNRPVTYIRHRNVTAWIGPNLPDWKLIDHLPNRYPWAGDPATESFAEFFVYGPIDA